MFKQLNHTNTGALTVDEFISVYDAVTLKWSPKDPSEPWYSKTWLPFRTVCKYSRIFVTWPYFEHIVCKFYIRSKLHLTIRLRYMMLLNNNFQIHLLLEMDCQCLYEFWNLQIV